MTRKFIGTDIFVVLLLSDPRRIETSGNGGHWRFRQIKGVDSLIDGRGTEESDTWQPISTRRTVLLSLVGRECLNSSLLFFPFGYIIRTRGMQRY